MSCEGGCTWTRRAGGGEQCIGCDSVRLDATIDGEGRLAVSGFLTDPRNPVVVSININGEDIWPGCVKDMILPASAFAPPAPVDHQIGRLVYRCDDGRVMLALVCPSGAIAGSGPVRPAQWLDVIRRVMGGSEVDFGAQFRVGPGPAGVGYRMSALHPDADGANQLIGDRDWLPFLTRTGIDPRTLTKGR